MLLVMASSFNGAQATATNPTTKDGIGFCVSAGQANYQAAGYTTGDDRSVRKGGTNDLIAAARTNAMPRNRRGTPRSRRRSPSPPARSTSSTWEWAGWLRLARLSVSSIT